MRTLCRQRIISNGEDRKLRVSSKSVGLLLGYLSGQLNRERSAVIDHRDEGASSAPHAEQENNTHTQKQKETARHSSTQETESTVPQVHHPRTGAHVNQNTHPHTCAYTHKHTSGQAHILAM